MKTCVTGGAGFIGSHLVDRLLADGHDVTVIDNFVTGRRENLSHVQDEIRVVEGDIRDRDAVKDAVQGCEVVFHQAALAAVARSIDDPHEVTAVNVGGTLNILAGAHVAGARRVVFASSSSVYGDTPVLPKVETMTLSPRSPYAATKVAGEAYLLAYNASFGLEGVGLRYFNVYGPRQSARSRYAAVVPLFMDAMSAGEPPTIYGDGGQTRDFSYVGDVVDAVSRAAIAPDAAGEVMNAGGGHGRVSILDLKNVIAEAVGYDGNVIFEETRAGDVRDSLADITRAERLLGWQPTTPLREGIALILAGQGASGSPA